MAHPLSARFPHSSSSKRASVVFDSFSKASMRRRYHRSCVCVVHVAQAFGIPHLQLAHTPAASRERDFTSSTNKMQRGYHTNGKASYTLLSSRILYVLYEPAFYFFFGRSFTLARVLRRAIQQLVLYTEDKRTRESFRLRISL